MNEVPIYRNRGQWISQASLCGWHI